MLNRILRAEVLRRSYADLDRGSPGIAEGVVRNGIVIAGPAQQDTLRDIGEFVAVDHYASAGINVDRRGRNIVDCRRGRGIRKTQAMDRDVLSIGNIDETHIA